MKKNKITSRGAMLFAPLVVAGMAVSSLSHAVSINTGNPDWDVNWTTELRLGLGWRTEGIKSGIGDDPTAHQSDYFAERGDMWKRRLDVISELDVIYRGDYGFRISAAGWYDHSYRDRDLSSNPELEGISASPDGRMSRQARRYYYGPSGEILDAFVFGTFNLGSTLVSAKAGQHALIWGVSQVNSSDSVSWSQQPANHQKGAESPGASPKELAMPLPQLSFQAQLNDTYSIAAYHHLDWKPDRMSEGGTFLGGPDFLFDDSGRLYVGTDPIFGHLYINQGSIVEPDNKRRGNYGVQLNINPEAVNASFGLVYRRMDEMQPWPVNFEIDPNDPITGLRFRQVYNRGVDLYGAFTNFSWKNMSWGAEISHRRGTALDSTGGPMLNGSLDGATGNTWHGLLNLQASMPHSGLYDYGVIVAEMAYTYLDEVTHNEQVYSKCDDATDGPGCGTRDASSFSLIVMPTWTQVRPGIDLNGSLTLAGYGLHGNSPVLMGAAERAFSWSAGVEADINMKYTVGLLYSDAHDVEQRIGAMGNTDRGRITLTFQTSL